MEAKQIYVPISQLATYINENPYGTLSQVLVGLWMKIDFEGYSKKLIELENQTGQSFKALTEWEQMLELGNRFGLDLRDRVKNSMKAECRSDLKRNQRAILRDVNLIKVNTPDMIEKREKLASLVTSFTNRGYGTHHENSAIDMYSSQTGFKITDQQRKVVKKVVTSQFPPVEWNLIGKIDGMATQPNGEEILVEIKNRTQRLFGVLKDYEKVQIQSYLKLTGLNQGHLVESLKINNSSSTKTPYERERKIKIIPVTFEPAYWTETKRKLAGFVSFFGDFLKNDQLQEMVMHGCNKDGEGLLKNILDTYLKA